MVALYDIVYCKLIDKVGGRLIPEYTGDPSAPREALQKNNNRNLTKFPKTYFAMP